MLNKKLVIIFTINCFFFTIVHANSSKINSIKEVFQTIDQENYSSAKEKIEDFGLQFLNDKQVDNICEILYGVCEILLNNYNAAEVLFLELSLADSSFKDFILTSLVYSNLQNGDVDNTMLNVKLISSTDNKILKIKNKIVDCAVFKAKNIRQIYSIFESFVIKKISSSLLRRINELSESDLEFEEFIKFAENNNIELQKIKSHKAKLKKTYNIGVFIPIVKNVNDFQNYEIDENILQVYRGVILAQDYLLEKNIHHKVHIFFDDGSIENMQKIMHQSDFKFLDSIIFIKDSPAIEQLLGFANKFLIPIFSLDENFYLGNLKNYLFFHLRSSKETKLKKIVDLIKTNITEKNKKVIILYSRDELQLVKKAKEFIKNYNIESVNYIELTDIDCSNIISNQIKNYKKSHSIFFNDYKIESFDDLCIVVLSNNEMIANTLISLVQMINNKISLLVPESWLYFDSVDISELLKIDIYFIMSNQTFSYTQAYKTFKNNFYNKFFKMPTYEAVLIYDFIVYLFEIMNSNGCYFFESLDSKYFFKFLTSSDLTLNRSKDTDSVCIMSRDLLDISI